MKADVSQGGKDTRKKHKKEKEVIVPQKDIVNKIN